MRKFAKGVELVMIPDSHGPVLGRAALGRMVCWRLALRGPLFDIFFFEVYTISWFGCLYS